MAADEGGACRIAESDNYLGA